MLEDPIKIGPIVLAPFNLPLKRRLQTLGALYYSFMTFFFPFINMFLCFYLLFFKSYWWVLGLYSIFYIYDFKTPRNGGRPSHFVQRSIIHKWFADYFPIKLIKTADLPPDQNYLLGYHPHGVISIGAISTFGTAAVGVFEKFAGLKIRVATLWGNFIVPLRREFLLAYGLIDCSRESLEHVLSSEEKGNAVVLAIGGAEEAIEAHPGGLEVLTLQRRKGFIKVALRSGAHLVPVFGFGENELFTQLENPEGSRIRSVQKFVKKLTGVTPMLFYGRGVFNYSFGYLPYRVPLNIVVGRPIPVEKVEEPTDEQIDELHARYVEALTELFESNKEKYGVIKDAELIVS
uniref:Acyltransferase n=1 Tax=Plectus sambesii TaxID=2011161 RepID=A0A914UPH4_9BILA